MWGWFKNKQDLVNENRELKSKVSSLTFEIVCLKYEMVKKDNKIKSLKKSIEDQESAHDAYIGEYRELSHRLAKENKRLQMCLAVEGDFVKLLQENLK